MNEKGSCLWKDTTLWFFVCYWRAFLPRWAGGKAAWAASAFSRADGLFLHGSLEGCESFVVAEAGRCSLVLDGGSFLALSLLGGGSCLLLGTSFGTLNIFEGAAVAEDDALAVLVELNHLEGEGFALNSVAAVFLHEVLGSGKAFNALLELNYGTLLKHFDDGTFVDATLREYTFEYIPRILAELLVAEAETTVVLVDFENDYLNLCANLSELRGMLYLLGPREVGDVDEAINTFFKFYEHTKVGEVANLSIVLAAYGILHFDVLPGIVLELLDAERHLALGAVEGEDNGFYFVAYLEEVLSRAEVLAPAHFADVDKTFYTGSDFNECAVVGHHDNLTLHLVANLEVGIEGIPGMGSELLETEGDALLVLIEVEDNDIEALVVADDFVGIVYAAPRKVGDVDETVNATKVNEYTIRGDVLDRTFT